MFDAVLWLMLVAFILCMASLFTDGRRMYRTSLALLAAGICVTGAAVYLVSF